MKLAFADMSLTLSCIFISSMDCFYRIIILPRLILCSAEKWRKAIIYYCYYVLYMWPDLIKWVVSRSLINDARALFRPLFQLFLISTSVFIFIGFLKWYDIEINVSQHADLKKKYIFYFNLIYTQISDICFCLHVTMVQSLTSRILYMQFKNSDDHNLWNSILYIWDSTLYCLILQKIEL